MWTVSDRLMALLISLLPELPSFVFAGVRMAFPCFPLHSLPFWLSIKLFKEHELIV